jgi:hypothetical protein
MSLRLVQLDYCYRCGVPHDSRGSYACWVMSQPETLSEVLGAIAIGAAGTIATRDYRRPTAWNDGVIGAVRELADWLRDLADREEQERREPAPCLGRNKAGPAPEPQPIREEWSK